MALAVSIIAIVVAIVCGWKWKLNTGIIAMVFAFFIATLCSFSQVNKAGETIYGPMTVNDVVQLFPITIVFYLIVVALFFGYVNETGAMEVLGKRLLYALRGNSKLLPWVIVLVTAVIAGLGAGASTPLIVGPFAFAMFITAGVSPVMCAMCVCLGNLIGSNNPYNGYGGIISKNLIAANGISDELAVTVSNYVWLNTIIINLLILAVFYFVLKAYKGKKIEVEVPPQFNPLQKRMIVMVVLVLLFMVVPAILLAWLPDVAFIVALARVCQPQLILAAAAVICAIAKVAPERKVIAACPWNTIVMIIGVYMLIQVANKAGLAQTMANLLSDTIPVMFVPVAVVAFAAFLSFFSSATSTVLPLMYPLVPGLAANLGLNSVMLYSCIFWGGLATCMSPFSTGGAITIASCPDEEVKDALPNKMIAAAVGSAAITIVAVFLGIFNMFSVAL